MRKLRAFLTVFLMLLLSGCGPIYPTNDDIIKETKKCTDAGMKVETIRSTFRTITAIQCAPPEDGKK